MKPKRELLRVVRPPEGEVAFDAPGKLPGAFCVGELANEPDDLCVSQLHDCFQDFHNLFHGLNGDEFQHAVGIMAACAKVRAGQAHVGKAVSYTHLPFQSFQDQRA